MICIIFPPPLSLSHSRSPSLSKKTPQVRHRVCKPWKLFSSSHVQSAESFQSHFSDSRWAAVCTSFSRIFMCHLALTVSIHSVSGRPENYCGCIVPVGEEACQRDDPHRLLLECLCPHWITAVHGTFETKVCATANSELNQLHQWHGHFQLDWIFPG